VSTLIRGAIRCERARNAVRTEKRVVGNDFVRRRWAIAIQSDNISTSASSAIGPPAAPGTGRGFIVLLGKATGVQLNTVAATSIFTTFATGGYTRCVVDRVVVDNPSGVATTASVSFGASGTPTDWAATATMPGLTGTNTFAEFGKTAGAGGATYGIGVSFVANVTVQQGVATTADFAAYGWYE